MTVGQEEAWAGGRGLLVLKKEHGSTRLPLRIAGSEWWAISDTHSRACCQEAAIVGELSAAHDVQQAGGLS